MSSKKDTSETPPQSEAELTSGDVIFNKGKNSAYLFYCNYYKVKKNLNDS